MDSNLIKMANDIAVNLGSLGDPSAIAEHINKFWSPPMRKRLHELYNNDPVIFNQMIVESMVNIRCGNNNPIDVEFKDKEGTGG